MFLTRVVVLALLLPALLPAQAQPSPADTIGASFGVTHDGGVPRAGGPRYTAAFPASGPIYTPLLGPTSRTAVGGPVDLQFTFVDARVGGQLLARGGDVAAQVAGHVVSYDRGAVVETYEARADGIEQSFVLAERPAAVGDLVVRGRITTALPLVQNGDDEVRFAWPCGAGVSFGAVTGVDANGATVRGSMRCRGDELELSLPASFVQSACYPLVLDPLVGTAFVVGDDPAYADFRPQIAYDETTNRFLVVWAVFVPATPSVAQHCEIRGQFVVPGGGNQGLQLLLSNSAFDSSRPQVANVNQSNRFLVAWQGLDPALIFAGGVVGRAVAASNGAMSNSVGLATTLGSTAYSDRFGLGGDSRSGLLAGSHALLAYRFAAATAPIPGTMEVGARRIHVPATGDPTLEPPVTVASSTNLLDDVTVTAHCGTAGRWMVVFGQSVTSPTGPMQRIVAQLVNSLGSLCGTPETIANNGAAGDVGAPTVATRDGNEFVVAWQNGVTNGIQLRRVVVSGPCGSNTWTFDGILSPLTNPGQAVTPALAFVKSKYLLAYQQYQLGWRVFTRALDPATCMACGSEQRVDSPVVVAGMPALASAWQGGNTTSEYALVAWCEGGAVKARSWTLHGTPGIESLGGGCGLSGLNDFATWSGEPVLGDSTFTVSLLAPTAPVLGLIVGFAPAAVPCGPCTLVASPDVVIATGPSLPIPIPCDASLIGAELYTQWLQFRAAGCPILPTLGLSNGLKFTIAE